MKQKEVFKKIGGIIQELSEQYDYLQSVADNLNDLELELFVANAHFLTDHIEILSKLNLQNKPKRTTVEKPETTFQQQKFFEPVVQQMKPGVDLSELRISKTPPQPVDTEVTDKTAEPNNEVVIPQKNEVKPIIQEKQPEEYTTPQFDFGSHAPSDSYSFIREEPETIRHELILDEAENWEDEDETVVENKTEAHPEKEENETPVTSGDAIALPEKETVKEITAAVPEPEETQAIADKPAEKQATEEPAKDEKGIITRNQHIQTQLGDKTASKGDELSIKPISDIKLAITLNDKLLYVKDLFNGYNLAYSEAIEILNRFNTFEEAQRFLKTNYVVKNNWEGKKATADKFYALLMRRYA